MSSAIFKYLIAVSPLEYIYLHAMLSKILIFFGLELVDATNFKESLILKFKLEKNCAFTLFIPTIKIPSTNKYFFIAIV